MKKLERLFKSHKNIVFLDFEGTQFSHEMIAIGAVSGSLDNKGKIKKLKKPFRIYVKAKNKIGKYVTNLTSITEEKLEKEGVSFATALEELKKYVGVNFKKSSFVTFGNHDLRILNQSIAYSFNYPKEICSQIQKNYVDYSLFISEFIKDEHGNPLSLIHYCELFNVKLAEPAHDPECDAINLANLHNAFLENREIVKERYKLVLKNLSHLPQPVANVMQLLASGESVTPQMFDSFISEYLK